MYIIVDKNNKVLMVDLKLCSTTVHTVASINGHKVYMYDETNGIAGKNELIPGYGFKGYEFLINSH